MNDDDLTQLMLVRPPRRAAPAAETDALVQQSAPIRAPSVGSRSAGETFFGDTDIGLGEPMDKPSSTAKRPEKIQAPLPNGRHNPRARAAHAVGVRRGVAFAALGGIALALALSLRAPGRTSPRPTGSSSTPKEATAQVGSALVPPGPDIPASTAPLVQVFPFEMSQQEAQWAELAHVAAQRGDCQEALELYQRLVNFSSETKERRVMGMSRWLPFLQQVRRRCWAEGKPNLLRGGAP